MNHEMSHDEVIFWPCALPCPAQPLPLVAALAAAGDRRAGSRSARSSCTFGASMRTQAHAS